MECERVLAKVVLITKDERELIDDFLDFYGALFGLTNVVVVDNGSTDPVVLDAYSRRVPLGLVVINDGRPFPQAGAFMSEHMRALKGSCEFILPLETDEFMFLDGPQGGTPVEMRERVHALLRAVDPEVSVIRYGRFWGSAVDPGDGIYADGGYLRPARQMTRFYDQGWDKLIVRTDAFVAMRQWCHHAIVDRGATATQETLGLLHFHETGFKRQIERSLTVLKTFRYVDTEAPLAKQLEQADAVIAAGVSCGHKVEYYAAYLRRRLCVDAFVRIAGRLPHDDEIAAHSVAGADPEASVRAYLGGHSGGKREPREDGASRDSLVYADVRKEAPLYVVTSVANILASLPVSGPSQAPQASLVGPNLLEASKGEARGTGLKVSEALARYAADHNERGTDKTTSHAYGDLYDAVFEPYRGCKRVLEIGVYSGASVLAFADFFEDAHVDGIDITLAKVKFGRDHPRVSFHRIDGTSADAPLMLGHVYDVILDDASHTPEHQVRTLLVFADSLALGGVFVIEDIDATRHPGLKDALAAAAAQKGLQMEWHDLRHIKGQHDDVVAVFRRF